MAKEIADMEEAAKADDEKTGAKNTQTAGNTYCIFAWLGIRVGPMYIESDKNGKPVGATHHVLTGLTDGFLSGYKDGIKGDCEKFGEAANNYAEKNGWTVVKNQYLKKDEKFFSDLYEAEGGKFASADEIRERMRAGVVHFKYKKVDKPAKVNKRTGAITPAVPGEVVERFGTLNQDLIQQSVGDVERAERRNYIPSNSVVVYFDIHATNAKTGIEGDWRCFRLDHFEGFVD